MFSIINRGELNAVTEHEFENFNARLKGLWLLEHNEDGSHTTEVATTYSANTFTDWQTIVSAGLRVQYLGERSSRYAPAYMSDNLKYVPLSGWELDDIATAGVVLFHNADGFTFYAATAGENPRSLTQLAVIAPTGEASFNQISLLNGQLEFPASQNSSSDVNTLDDYEEGSWTPSLTGAGGQTGQVYALQSGTYTKIGRECSITAMVQLSTLGTFTGGIQLAGLPFAVGATTSNRCMMSAYWANMTTPMVYMTATTEAGLTIATIYAAAAAAASLAGIAQADLSATTLLIFSGTYHTAT